MEEIFQNMCSQIGASFVDPAKQRSRRLGFIQRSFCNCRWHCGGVKVHRSGAYVYAIHVNKRTELKLILVNTNRGTERLHYKFASGMLNSATWRYVFDKSLHSVAESYKKENLCNCYSRVTTRRNVSVNPLIGRYVCSFETITPACHYNVESYEWQ
jgi:hypothetical protein